MNIFVLDGSPEESARQHNDKHTVKMCIEYAQLLSTAHRVLDGHFYYGQTKNGRRIQRWFLADEREHNLYKATHVNHPSAIWARDSEANYLWLSRLFDALLSEYTYRYGRTHKSSELLPFLRNPPVNISNTPFTMPPQAMPDYCKRESAVEAYRTYYIEEKAHIAQWSKRNVPGWFVTKKELQVV